MSGSSGSPAETMRRRAGRGRRVVRLASIRYSVGAWQSTLTPSASSMSSRSAGSKRPSWITAAAPVSHGARKTLRADFDQPGRGRAPDKLAVARPEPVLGLGLLAEQVAVGVDDAARLAGGAGGEDDQRRVLGVHLLDRRRASPAARSSSRTSPTSTRVIAGTPVGEFAEQALLADAERRRRRRDPQLEVVAAQLRVAGQRDRAHPPAGEQRQHPLDPVADQRHHHVAPLRPRAPRRRRRARPSRRSVRRSASRAGCPRSRSRRSPAARRGSAPSRPRSKFTAGSLSQSRFPLWCNA